MKLLFVMFDGGGNVPPQLGVASELRARGAEIHVLGHAGLRQRIEAEGFAFEAFSAARAFDPTGQRSLLSMMTDFARVAADRRYGTEAVNAARRLGVDAVVVDMVLNAAIAEVMNSEFPTVVFVHCFYRAVQDAASSPIGWLLRLRGIAPLGAETRDVLQIVTARAELDPVKGHPAVEHVGTVWQGDPAPAVEAEIPRILVSLSTCAFAGQRRMLQNILDAVAGLPVQATVTVGPGIDAAGLRAPANATMHAWLDHDEVLRTASLVVGHGGHSTAMRAMSFGVPMVIMPANPLIDQVHVGAAVERIGAGVLLRKHAGAGRIRAAVEQVLGDDSYQRAAGRLGDQIRQRNGARTAADAISGFVSRRPRAVSPQR